MEETILSASVDSTDVNDTHNDVNNDANSAPAVTYGHTSHGEYITPYNMTIVFHEDSLFETAAAFLGSRSQIVPIARPNSQHNTIDYDAVASACEYLTPEVLIFGAEFPRSAILKFFERGFQFVHVFVYKMEDGEKYMEVVSNVGNVGNVSNDNSVVTTVVTADSALDMPVKREFDQRISVFTVDTFYDHLVLIEGLASVIAFEHVLIGTFPKYSSVNPKLTYQEGRFFLDYIVDTKKHIGKTLLELVSSYKGYEMINQMVVSGRAMDEAREILANRRIMKGVLYTLNVTDLTSVTSVTNVTNVTHQTDDTQSAPIDTTVIPPNTIAIDGCDLVEEMLQLLPVHPLVVKNKLNYVLFYALANSETHASLPPQTTMRSWNVTLVTLGNSALNTLEILRLYQVTNLHGAFNRSTGIISSAATITLHSLLPFGI